MFQVLLELETIDLYFISGFKVLGLFKLIDFTKQSILQAENYSNALRGIAAMARSTGEEVETVFQAINKLAEDGRIPVQDLAEAMRNLLPKYGLADSIKLIEAIKTTGTVLGTQGGMPQGTALKRVTQGVAQWLSTLTDATLVTKNLDMMVQEYANTLRVNADALDENQRYHAVLLGFLKEASILYDAEDQAIQGLTGTLAKDNQALMDFKNVYGQTLAPMTVEIVENLTEGIKLLGKFLAALEKGFLSLGYGAEMALMRIKALLNWKNLFKSGEDIIAEQADAMEYMRKQYEEAIKEINAKYGVGSVLKGAQIEISANFKQIKPPDIGNVFSGISSGYPSLGGTPWWMKQETFTVDFGKMIDLAKAKEAEENARKMGEKIATAFSYPLERGISDVFFNLFVGEKGSFIEMARNFGKSLARAISDAMAEAMIAPVKNWMSGLFSGLFSAGGAALGGSIGGGSVSGGSMIPAGGLMGGFGARGGININVGSGYTPREIGDMVTQKLQEGYSNNSSIRKVIKSQR